MNHFKNHFEKLRVLNLYAGIGGNRKLWEGVDVTAVELDPDIAEIYQDFYPDDKVVVGDAHEYLLKNFSEFDFIWSSPPCPSHSRMRMLWKGESQKKNNSKASFKFPDMKLYEEIIFLNYFFKGKFCVENVISYYDPLIPPVKSDSHYFWANFRIGKIGNDTRGIRDQQHELCKSNIGFDLSEYDYPKRFKRDLIANCVRPETGRYILNCARNIITKSNTEQTGLFEGVK